MCGPPIITDRGASRGLVYKGRRQGQENSNRRGFHQP